MRATSPSDGVSRGRVGRTATIGCSRNPLTGMSSGVSAPRTRTAVEWQRDLFVRFAQRRLLERLAGIDHAARQRHLTAMPQRVGAHGEDDVRVASRSETQQQPRRSQILLAFCDRRFLVDSEHQQGPAALRTRRVEAGRPAARRTGASAPALRARQRGAEPVSSGAASKVTSASGHGTMVIPAQLLCGAG